MKLKKAAALFFVLVMMMNLIACGGKSESPDASDSAEGEAAEAQGETEEVLKACFITEQALGNDFVDLIWLGFQQLEEEGWEIKCIEALESAEFADDIRNMAADGYSVIMTYADNVNNVALELAPEIEEMYPETHLFLLDTYVENDYSNVTTVSVDPFESSFVAGYVAAKTTETGTIGWIGHTDMVKIRRFRDGYIAGAAYADPSVQVEYSFTGDPFDPTIGQEAGEAMISNYPVDIIYQSCYLAGPGVITACANAGIKCIGVDDWQGDIDDCVFWSALKPMDIAVYTLGSMYADGEELKTSIDFNIASGGTVYDERDFEKLPKELQQEVLDIVSGIQDGTIDVYEGFEEYRLDY